MTPDARGKVIGGVVGGVLGALLVLGCVVVVVRQRRRRAPVHAEAAPMGAKSSLESDVSAAPAVGAGAGAAWLDRPPTLPPIPPSPQLSLDDGPGTGPGTGPGRSSLSVSDLRPSLRGERAGSFADRADRAERAERGYSSHSHSSLGLLGPLEPRPPFASHASPPFASPASPGSPASASGASGRAHSPGARDERPASSHAHSAPSAPSAPSSCGHGRPTSSQYAPHTGVSATGTFGPPHTPTSASASASASARARPPPAELAFELGPLELGHSDSASTISTLGALRDALFGRSERR